MLNSLLFATIIARDRRGEHAGGRRPADEGRSRGPRRL